MVILTFGPVSVVRAMLHSIFLHFNSGEKLNKNNEENTQKRLRYLHFEPEKNTLSFKFILVTRSVKFRQCLKFLYVLVQAATHENVCERTANFEGNNSKVEFYILAAHPKLIEP